MNIAFWGTPWFSVPALEALTGSGHNVSLVVTQPDKGRRTKLIIPPVKQAALASGIEVIQPETIKSEALIDTLAALNHDLNVVIAYGKILPAEILNMPKFKSLNVHASVLPNYRGAAPIQWAIINGDTETGVSTMLMDEGIDTGPVYYTEREIIKEDDTYESLSLRLAKRGAELLIKTLTDIEAGTATATPQNGTSTYARILRKEDGLINWNKSAAHIVNTIRGLYPWPGAYTFFNRQRVKILRAKAVITEGSWATASEVIHQNTRDGLVVACGEGTLSILELQPEGKKAMSCADFIAGRVKTPENVLYVG
ncbi:MAG: methionyl-tRNA formyltransferase [Nitrospirae bacterium]|nr:methionyl-tRNA formyltransferase [Nitrospirota bacterium]MBF0533825.1 methionyl-tRNA formyltransferase [Nitrospirota bacterium]MBF0615466.1 methionyl-tRNA formyltransferase [Nitrospirota bacterium]